MKNRLIGLVNSFKAGYVQGRYKQFVNDEQGAGATANVMMLYLGIAIGSAFGLALTPTIYEFSRDAGYAFNNSPYQPIFEIIYELGIPALYAMCCIAGIGGVIYAFYRMARRL